jgi:peroxiredoxin family protein
MDEIGRKHVREELFKVIEYQMRKGRPKETKQTFDRLRAAGYSRKETMRLLACALLVELHEMVRDKRTYDEAIYVKKLMGLPKMPWSDEPEDCT